MVAARSGPVAADLLLGCGLAAVTAARDLARAGAAPLRFAVEPALRVADWPPEMRALAERGHRQRQAAGARAVRVFRRVAPRVVTTVLDELDLAGLVREVLEKVDLPEIIRTSTGSVAGDAVRDVRIQVMAADDVVARWAGRVLPRRECAAHEPRS